MGANSRGGLLKTFCSRVGANSRGAISRGGANSRIYGMCTRLSIDATYFEEKRVCS